MSGAIVGAPAVDRGNLSAVKLTQRSNTGPPPDNTPSQSTTQWQPSSAELSALAALVGLGLVTRTATGTYVVRSLAVSLPLVVSNPAGTAGNPTLSLNAVPASASPDTNDTKIRVTIGGQQYDLLAVLVP